MPDLGELASDVEPGQGLAFPRPGHRKQRRAVKLKALDEVRQVHACPGVQVGQHTRAETFGGANPRRVQFVDVGDEVTVALQGTLGAGRCGPVALEREPAQRRVHEMCHDVPHPPRAGNGRPAPRPGWQRLEQCDQFGRQRTEEEPGVCQRKRHGHALNTRIAFHGLSRIALCPVDPYDTSLIVQIPIA